MFKIVIYDNKKEKALVIRDCVKEVCINKKVNFQLSTYYTSPMVVINKIKNSAFEYDILCLSINEWDNHAFEIAKQLRDQNNSSAIIFISETSNKVFEVFKYMASDYILEPINKEAISKSFSNIFRVINKSKSYFTIKSKEILARIPYKSIDFFESCLRNVKMYLNDEKLSDKVFIAKLVDVHNSLPHNNFVRCHQSYIINLDNVRYLDRAQKKFILHSSREVYISKRNYPEVLNIFMDWRKESNTEIIVNSN